MSRCGATPCKRRVCTAWGAGDDQPCDCCMVRCCCSANGWRNPGCASSEWCMGQQHCCCCVTAQHGMSMCDGGAYPCMVTLCPGCVVSCCVTCRDIDPKIHCCATIGEIKHQRYRARDTALVPHSMRIEQDVTIQQQSMMQPPFQPMMQPPLQPGMMYRGDVPAA